MNIVLTKRQREVCALLMLGLSQKEIAKRLSISLRTAEDHVRDVEIRFGVNSISCLVYKLWKLPEYDLTSARMAYRNTISTMEMINEVGSIEVC